MNADVLLLGVDGGGTRCRARLCTPRGAKLAEATAGPANIRFGVHKSLSAVLQATNQCLEKAGLSPDDAGRMVACLALAGASEPRHRCAAEEYHLPYRRTIVTTDARAACVGAHGGRDGGVIVVGTGTVGWAELNGRQHRVGGWGLPISDEGSGAWLGCEALRRVLWAYDSRIAWTGLLTALFEKFQSDPHAVVYWASAALPRDFGSFAPLVVEHASRNDAVAIALMQAAAGHLDALAARLVALGADRLALVGGLAPALESWLASGTRDRLVRPIGDAVDGALQLAGAAANALAVE